MHHKDMEVWKQAMDLVGTVYRMTTTLPQQEQYGLSAQLRRAAVSIPSNISEGSARRSNKEFLHFLNVSLGSVAEIETQLLIIEMLGYADIDDSMQKLERVRALILGLRNRIKQYEQT